MEKIDSRIQYHLPGLAEYFSAETQFWSSKQKGTLTIFPIHCITLFKMWQGNGLPCWSSAWESACQCRGHRFNPWSRKIPHAIGAAKPVRHNYGSLWSLALQPQMLRPMCPRAHALQRKKPPQWAARPPQLESSPQLPPLEKSLRSNKDTAMQKKKNK